MPREVNIIYFRKYIGRLLATGATAVFLSSSPAAAQCVIDKDQMLDPFAFNRSSYEIVHKDSGFVFPSIVAGFRRECEMTKDFTGNNFEINYVKDIGDHGIDVKITVVHLVDLSAQDHYQIIKPDLMSRFSSAAPKSEGEYFVSGRPELDAYQGIFDSEFEGIPWHFSITAIDYGHWDARLTVSYPEEIDVAAQEDVLKLITAFQWQTPEGLTHEEPED